MNITLKIDENGKKVEKTFVNDFIPARILREALKLNEEMAKKQKSGEESITDSLDESAEFVVRVFNNQFTLDQLWDGMELAVFQDEIARVFNEVLGLGGLALQRADTNSGKPQI